MAEVNPVTYDAVMRHVRAFQQQLSTRPDWGYCNKP